MSFLFKACFEPQVEAEHYFEKEYSPKVDLMPQSNSQPYLKKAKIPSIVANKLRSRGAYNKPHLQKDYDDLSLRVQDYRQFLGKKRNDRQWWGSTYDEYQRRAQ